jgi:hypothetical protein
MPWADQLITYRTGKTKAKGGKGQFFDLAAGLQRGTSTSRSCCPTRSRRPWSCKMARIPRILATSGTAAASC